MPGLLDLHVHPSLKMYYLPFLKANFHAPVYSGGHWNPLSFRTRYKNLNESPVKVMLSAHYVIEQGFVGKGLKWFARGVAWGAAPSFYGKLRLSDPYKSLLKMMDTLEKAEKNTNRWVFGNNKKFKMVTSFDGLKDLEDHEIALVHAIEGSHALGYGPEKDQSLEDFWTQTEQRLDYIKNRGVCMITLGHFWNNMFCPQTDGTESIPKKVNGKIVAGRDDALFQMKRANWRWGDADHLADEFSRAVLEKGMLIDVAHAQEHARQKIYDICEEYKRPVVASHNGLQHFFNHEYNLSDAEIKRIHSLGGIIGLILSKRLLVPPIRRYKDDGNGIPTLIENMLYIKDLVGDVNSIGIGTDFDGLTHPFKDCFKPSHLPRISDAMSKHFSDEEIEKVFIGNGMRVLEKGWL